MKTSHSALILCLGIIFCLGSCVQTPEESLSSESMTLGSPEGLNTVRFFIKDGRFGYTVAHKNSTVIDSSFIGFEFRDLPAFGDGLEVLTVTKEKLSETWEMPWGEQRLVQNNYHEIVIELGETGELKRRMDVICRVYDDGVGFRYRFPEQDNLGEILITDEHTEFALTGDHDVWWIPGDWDIYEHLYTHTKFSGIDAISKRDHPNLAQTYIPENAVNTPVTMKTSEGLYLSFHEANLTDYPGMTLKVDAANLTMTSELVGSELLGGKAVKTTPFVTPWRTIQIADRAGDLIESNLIVNLNEPNKLGNVSWFTPMKYIGIWWEMHMEVSSWDMASGKHGATTEHTKDYIDFAAENNIGGVLVEGWNTGWEHWIGFDDREGVFDFVTPYPDYDLNDVVQYAREKGVEIIMHHETSAAPRTYDQQMDTAYSLMESLGIHSVKTGYVGKIIPEGEYHHGQWMVNHYRRALLKGAEHKVAINAHEPIKATGIRRTYPNAISREGLRGQEFNAWSVEKGNPPEHLPTVVFTRMLAGPIDFTPGIFKIKLAPEKPGFQINTTLAHQLGLYVVIYSPIQMAADLIENYEGNDAFQFIREVGVDWERTEVLDGDVGDFVVIARKERETENWFVGGITGTAARTYTLNLEFLDPGSYTARIYKDAPDAHWNDNPTAYVIDEITVRNTDEVVIDMAEGGGFAISLFKQ